MKVMLLFPVLFVVVCRLDIGRPCMRLCTQFQPKRRHFAADANQQQAAARHFAESRYIREAIGLVSVRTDGLRRAGEQRSAKP
jgi:hypothetical protein